MSLFSISYLTQAGTVTREHESWNTAARDAYIAPLASEKLKFEGAIKNFGATIDKKKEEVLAAKLRLSEIYTQREEILQNRQDLIREYQTQKASMLQATQIKAVLQSLVDLLQIASKTELQEQTLAIIRKYLEAKQEDRVSVSKDLEKLIAGEIDPEQKDALVSLKKTLAYYGLTFQMGGERQTSQLVATALDQLLNVSVDEAKKIGEVEDLLQATLNDFATKAELSTQALAEIKSQASTDFDALEGYNLQIQAENKLIQENKSYNDILEIEIKKCSESIVELDKKIALAPPPVKVVTYSREYNDMGGGINR